MKHLFKTTIVILTIAFAITSCNKDGDPIIPDPGPGDNPEQWNYDIGVGSVYDITPAIDDNDNIYFSIANIENNMIVAVGIDKDGNELWKNEYEGSITDKVMCANGKVIVSTGYPTAIYCLDGLSGATLWSKNLTEEYDFFDNPNMAIANNKIYLVSHQDFYGFIASYDFNGTELWLQQIESGFNLSMIGNSLYFHDWSTLYRYDDNGTSCDFVWEWDFPGVEKSRSMNILYDIPIGADGNIYIRDEELISIVSQDGSLVGSVTLDPTYYEGYNSNIVLTSDNEILLGKGNLVKLSNDGSVIWETNINDGLYINPTFNTAPVIAANGKLYDAQLFGLYCINPSGTLNWKHNSETGGGEESGNLHPPVLTHEGNIVSVSSEQGKVRCFKGDGQGLATNGWPKPFGDYGNTSAR